MKKQEVGEDVFGFVDGDESGLSGERVFLGFSYGGWFHR